MPRAIGVDFGTTNSALAVVDDHADPRFAEFLKLKRQYDPDERFQSDWYRHYKSLFADKL